MRKAAFAGKTSGSRRVGCADRICCETLKEFFGFAPVLKDKLEAIRKGLNAPAR